MFRELRFRVRQALMRFPQSIAIGAILATLLVITIDGPSISDRWLLTLSIALTWSLGAELLIESSRTRFHSALIRGVALLPSVILFGLLAGEQYHAMLGGIVIAIAGFLLTLSAPLWGRTNSDFWRFHLGKSTSVIWGATVGFVLFAGVRLALLALEELVFETHLFGRDVTAEIFVIAAYAGFVVTLGKVPRIKPEDEMPEPNMAWRRGGEYLAAPLSFIYLAILYLFLARIIVDWRWPQGFVGWMVLSFSAVALVTWLLLKPGEAGKGDRLEDSDSTSRTVLLRYRRVLLLLVLPLLPVVLLAFHVRISEYGWTEPRLFGVLLASWFMVIAAIYGIRPRLPYQSIPLSLGLLLIPLAFGPLNPTTISISDQSDRLEQLLRTPPDSAAEVRSDGNWNSDDDVEETEQAANRREVRSIGWYLEERSALDRVLEARELRAAYEDAIEFDRPERVESAPIPQVGIEAIELAGYDLLLPIEADRMDLSSGMQLVRSGSSISWMVPEGSTIFRVQRDDDELLFNLAEWSPHEELNDSAGRTRGRLVVKRARINGRRPALFHLSGYLLLQFDSSGTEPR